MGTEKLADLITTIDYGRIPQEAISQARTCILDGIGVMLAGSRDPVSERIVQYVKEMGGTPEAGVIASRFKTCSPFAALANGTMGHALDYDDVAENGMGHPTVVILPTILALGERENISGREALTAYVLGWEIGARLARSLGAEYDFAERGWHPTGVLGTMVSAAIAAKILRLNAKQTRNALGIGASEAGGLRLNFGTNTKPLHAGNAGKNGIMAALLAQKGFTASEAVLEGPLGFCKVFTGHECDVARVSKALGESFDIASPGPWIKPYPSCGLTHHSIDAILYLIQRHSIRAEEVAEVECETIPAIPKFLMHSRPRTSLEAKFSLEYCVAAALIDGEVGLEQFTDEKVQASRAQSLLKKVRYTHPKGAPESTPMPEILVSPQKVTVKLQDGTKYSHEVSHPRGTPQNPLSEDDLVSKFRKCASLALSPEEVERSQEVLLGIDKLEDITRLTQIITRC